VRKNIWGNSTKTIELARTLRRVVLAAFVSYGLVALTIRFVEALVLRRAAGISWPLWDVVSLLISVAAGALSFLALREPKQE
jgi:serine/threonine-protein kinase